MTEKKPDFWPKQPPPLFIDNVLREGPTYDTVLVHASSSDLSGPLERLRVFVSLMEDLEIFYQEDTYQFYDEKEGLYAMYCRIPHDGIARANRFLTAAWEINLITDSKVLPGDLVTGKNEEEEVP